MTLYQLVASIEFHRKRFDKCLEICHMVIYMCAEHENLQGIRQDMLEKMAMSHMKMHKYEEALVAWKLCFEHCLRTNNSEGELHVYEQLSLCYFYQGQMKGAEYFNTRFRMGILEEPDSQVRRIYAQLRRNDDKQGSWDK